MRRQKQGFSIGLLRTMSPRKPHCVTAGTAGGRLLGEDARTNTANHSPARFCCPSLGTPPLARLTYSVPPLLLLFARRSSLVRSIFAAPPLTTRSLELYCSPLVARRSSLDFFF